MQTASLPAVDGHGHEFAKGVELFEPRFPRFREFLHLAEHAPQSLQVQLALFGAVGGMEPDELRMAHAYLVHGGNAGTPKDWMQSAPAQFLARVVRCVINGGGWSESFVVTEASLGSC